VWLAFVSVSPRLLRLSVPMLLGVSLIPLGKSIYKVQLCCSSFVSGWRAFSSVSLCNLYNNNIYKLRLSMKICMIIKIDREVLSFIRGIGILTLGAAREPCHFSDLNRTSMIHQSHTSTVVWLLLALKDLVKSGVPSCFNETRMSLLPSLRNAAKCVLEHSCKISASLLSAK
jgi:hypothetical protein